MSGEKDATNPENKPVEEVKNEAVSSGDQSQPNSGDVAGDSAGAGNNDQQNDAEQQQQGSGVTEQVATPETTEIPSTPAVVSAPKVSPPTAEQIAAAQRAQAQKNKPTPKAAPVSPKATSTVNAGAGVEAIAAKTKPSGIPEVDALLKDVPLGNCSVILTMVDYIANMTPRRPISAEDGARRQVGLYRAITGMINGEDQHFKPLFTALLKLWDLNTQENGVFHEYNVNRFVENMQIPQNDRRAFVNLNYILTAMKVVKTRGMYKTQINWGEMLRYGLNEAGRQRVLAYFEL